MRPRPYSPSRPCSFCFFASGLPCVSTPIRKVCSCSATCRSTSRWTVPTPGRTGKSCWSTKTAAPAALPVCRRTTSVRTASSGAIRCTTGKSTRPDGYRVVDRSPARHGGARRPRAHRPFPRLRVLLVRAGGREDGSRRRLGTRAGRRDFRCDARRRWATLPIVAEDLGVITPEVEALAGPAPDSRHACTAV